MGTPATRIGRQAGRRTRRRGAALTRIWGVRTRRRNHMIATLGTRTGRLDGLPTRRSGAAPTRRWGARRRRPNHTIAMLVIPIGRLAGLPTRRSGAAPTRRWGAPRGTERPTARGLYSESSRNAAALSMTADTEPDAKLFQLIVCCHGDDSSTRAR